MLFTKTCVFKMHYFGQKVERRRGRWPIFMKKKWKITKINCFFTTQKNPAKIKNLVCIQKNSQIYLLYIKTCVLKMHSVEPRGNGGETQGKFLYQINEKSQKSIFFFTTQKNPAKIKNLVCSQKKNQRIYLISFKNCVLKMHNVEPRGNGGAAAGQFL